VFTSDNGVEGLGFVFITTPTLVIIDTTLPKYSGREVLDFLVHNPKFHSDETKVIVFHEGEQKNLNLPKNFSIINKNDKDSFRNFSELVFNILTISDPSHSDGLFNKLSRFVLKNSNQDDLLNKSIEQQPLFKRFFLRFKWTWLELSTSLVLTLIILLFGRADDENISQQDIDKKAFRTKYYPTLVVTFVSLTIIFINLGLFFTSQLSLLRDVQLPSSALTTFTVDSTADTADFSIGDNVCDTDDSVGDGPCTLRAAIEEANSLAGADNINFDIPGTAPFEILTSALLPVITTTVHIDGSTQGGNCTTDAFSTPVVIISANPNSYNTKLIFSTGSENSTLKGMKFESAHVGIENTSDITLTCNWFNGTDPDNTDNLQIINSSDIIVGGIKSSNNVYQNYFFNSNRHGINIQDSNYVSVFGNSIGLYETQTTQTAAGNNNAGIRVTGNSNNINIGTSIAPSASCSQGCNIIASNQIGVLVEDFSGTSVVITGNKIGTGRVAFEDFGNDVYGVQFNGAVQVNSNRIVASSVGIGASGSNWIIQSNWIGDNLLGNSTGIALGSPLNNTQIMSNVIMGNESGISLGGINVGDLGPLLISENIIGLQADGITPAPNDIGINLVAGDTDDPYFDDSDIEITANTISSNQTGLSHIAHVSGGHPYIHTINSNNFESNGTAIKFNLPVSIITTNNSFKNNAISIEVVEGNSNEIINNNFNQMAGVIRIVNSDYNIITQNFFKSDSYNINLLSGSSYNPIIQNQFSTAYGQNIELSDDGPTINDLGDVDVGPNNLQNYPTNFSLEDSIINFTLDTESGNYTIEFHILEEDPDLTPSSLMCSDTVIHTGGIQQFSIDCPNLPTGEINLQALAIKMLAPDEWGDTSEFSPIEIVNNPSPTNTLTPTPLATNTPIPVPTNTPVPVPTNTDVPLPTSTTAPAVVSSPTVVSTLAGTRTPVPTASDTPTVTPTGSFVTSDSTPVPTLTPVPTIDTPIITDDSDTPSSNTTSYVPPEESVVNLPVVKSMSLALASSVEDVPVLGSLLDRAIEFSGRIKPLTDNLSYLLSLQFVGSSVATSGVTAINLLALAAPAIASTFAQPRLFYYALAWFWKRKSKLPWGIISDKFSHAPVAFARVTLVKDGQRIDSQTTDLQGKYGFMADKGEYQIFITHPDYTDFSKEVSVKYDGQTLAQDFEVSSKAEQDFGSSLTWVFYQARKFIKQNLFVLNTIIFATGFVYTVFAVANSLTVFNYIILSLYLLQIVLIMVFYFTASKKWGQVLDVSTGEVIPGAIVRLLNNERQLDVTITDPQGRYNFILEPGEYYLKVTAPGYIFPTDETPNVVVNQAGEKLMSFSVEKTERLNIKLYLQRFSNVAVKRNAILSPFN